jgi:hypothetical protein
MNTHYVMGIVSGLVLGVVATLAGAPMLLRLLVARRVKREALRALRSALAEMPTEEAGPMIRVERFLPSPQPGCNCGNCTRARRMAEGMRN